MVWYKAWLDTRWRFLIGLVLLIGSGAVMVIGYPSVASQLELVESAKLGEGIVADQIRQAAEAARDFRGFVWWQWFRQSLRETWTLFAVLLGTGGLLAQASGGGALYTLSLPVSRERLLSVRAATSLGELLVMALVPALAIPLLSPAIGQTYPVSDAIVHALCLFVGGSVFFSMAFLLSTVFADIWRPALIALAIAYGFVLTEMTTRNGGAFGILRLMSAQTYYQSGDVPWLGLAAAAALSLALLYGAVVNIRRRDF